ARKRETPEREMTPAEPSRGEAKGGWCRHDQGLLGRDVAREHGAHAVVERIARGEHADLTPAHGKDFFDSAGEGIWPGLGLAPDEGCGEAQMAFAAEHDIGRGGQGARARA